MRIIPKAANDMMDVARLQGFDVSILILIENNISIVLTSSIILFFY